MTTNYTATGKQVETPDTLKTPVKDYDRYVKKHHRKPSYQETKEIPSTTEQPVEVKQQQPLKNPSPQAVTGSQNTVVVNGQSYSVAPELQREFIQRKSQSSPTIPRTVSPQETQSVPVNVDTSRVPFKVEKQTGGEINARRPGDFATRYDSEGNRLTPSSLDIAQSKATADVGGSELNPVGAGVVAGLFSVSKVVYSLFEASNLNSNELNREAVQSNIKRGAFEVVKDPFSRLVADPLLEVGRRPLYEGSKLATELLILEGASKTVRTVVDDVASVNKYSGADVRASAYDVSSQSERAGVFLEQNQISPSASGTPDFVPVRQLTVDVSQFNKNQKYFSKPELDVPVDRQFTLAGTEKLPPKNPPGILPLDERPVAPFESNKLTIEQIGKKPLIDATSTSQSRMVDLPVAKSFNKDSLQGTPIIDLQNPGASALLPDDSVQSSLGQFGIKDPISGKVSSVPKGSQSPLIYERSSVVPDKPLPDNSFAFESDGPAVSVVESTGSNYPARPFGAESRLEVNRDYVFDPASREFVRRGEVADVVTPRRVRNVGFVGGSLAPITMSLLPETSVNPELSNVSVSPEIVPEFDVFVPPVQEGTKALITEGDSTQLNIVGESSDSASKSKDETSSITIQSPVPDVIEMTAQAPKVSVLQSQSLREQSRPKLSLMTGKVKPIIPGANGNRQVKSGAGMFDVLVRKQGKFVLVGSGYSDLATAFNRGRQEVKDTARASFKVVSRFGVVQRLNIGSDRSLQYSKRDPGVIVQKREFRIESAGEKQEISRKGIFVQKARKSLNKKTKGIFG